MKFFVLFLLLFSLVGCRSNSEERGKALFSDAAILVKQQTEITERWARELAEVFTDQNGDKFPSNRDWFISRGEKIIPLIDESSRLANEAADKYEEASRLMSTDRDKKGMALLAASTRKDVEVCQLYKALAQIPFDRTINDKETLIEKAGSLNRIIKQKQIQQDEQFKEGIQLLRMK
jgi:hypothetical protein